MTSTDDDLQALATKALELDAGIKGSRGTDVVTAIERWDAFARTALPKLAAGFLGLWGMNRTLLGQFGDAQDRVKQLEDALREMRQLAESYKGNHGRAMSTAWVIEQTTQALEAGSPDE